MKTSPEKGLSQLEVKYGPDVKASPQLLCFPNAVRAAFHIYNVSNGDVLPRIWRVVFPELKDSHAYLQIGSGIYNEGVTWPNNKYPNLNLEEIRKHGLDVTTAALTEAYLEWSQTLETSTGFKEAISSLGYSDSKFVLKKLDDMISKSVQEEK